MHDPTPMEPSNDEIFSLPNHLGELVHSPTSYTSIFFNVHPNEVWVKGLFFMVPHEECETPISPFDYGMTRVPSLHLQQHPFLHYDDIHIHPLS